MAVTLLSWNLHGASGVDAGRVVEHVRAVGADVACFQEIRRHQLRPLTRALGVDAAHWTFKHGMVPFGLEGQAVVGVRRPVERPTVLALTRRLRWWSWRRRIAQVWSLDVDGTTATAVQTHLSPHAGGAANRRREVERLLALAPDPSRLVVVGDLNEGPDGPVLGALRAAGLRDGWATAPVQVGPGPTNWTGPRQGPADQRIDHVVVGSAFEVMRAQVPDSVLDDSWVEVSDHLPLAVTIARR